MYKAIVKRLMRRFKDRYQLNKDHFYLTLACAVEWGLDDKELMIFLWKEIKLFDKGDEPTLKEEVEEIHKFVKNHIADGSGLSLLHGYYNIKATIPSAINNSIAEHDTKIISSAIDNHDCIKKAGNRCIRIKEILEYLKIHEPHLFMIMKEKRVEVFTARILQNKGYIKTRDRLGTIWENPHMLVTKKVKLTYNSPTPPPVAKPVDAKTTAIKLMYQWARWHIKQNDGNEIFIQDIVEVITKKCPQYGNAVMYSSLKDDIAKTVFNKFGYVRKGWSGLYVKNTVS